MKLIRPCSNSALPATRGKTQPHHKIPFSPSEPRDGKLSNVIGCYQFASADKFTAKTIDWYARKKLDVQDLMTHRFKLKNFEEAIRTAADPAQKTVKVVITG